MYKNSSLNTFNKNEQTLLLNHKKLLYSINPLKYLIYVYINKIQFDMNIPHFHHNTIVQLVLLK